MLTRDLCTQLHDMRTLDVIKTFPTETPLNSAAIALTWPFVRTPEIVSALYDEVHRNIGKKVF